ILAVAAANRLPQAPELPTATEAGVAGYQAAAFVGIVAPTGLPENVAKVLGEAVAAAVADPAVRTRLEGMGSLMASATEATPPGFAAFLQRETAWTRAAAERAGLRQG
ncbi:MAG: tripartite tricarboxylate transporter substrate-binding protein, partial [Alphaproteobacteria bacterium]|nr:tripartite tricarboxylate transporter substrate-binding protein [Alphaproteobacteria bacterium]